MIPARRRARPFALCALLLATPCLAAAADGVGYYRFPAIHGSSVVFTAEGDLWRVTLAGGVAERLTSHPGQETNAAISPDGTRLAFTATYDGPAEAYVMPLAGGLPKRLTYDGDRATVVGWTPAGSVLVATRKHSTLPNLQLVAIDPATLVQTRVPLWQASEGAWAGSRLVFTRFEAQPAHTKRYRGGRVQQLWTWPGGAAEARPLFPGDSATSRNPMIWNDRVYFIGDRDLCMNLWSAKLDGSDLRQHTFHREWDVRTAALDAGRIVYQLGADLRVYDIAAGKDSPLAVTLASDFDQLRERWVDKPMDYLTAWHASPDGDRVVLTARGQVYVAPVKDGRFVEATRRPGVRYRNAHFLPDGKSVIALSDESGEVEFWRAPANGVGEPSQLTRDGRVLRWDGIPSPDGKWIAHYDKDQQLWLFEIATGAQKKIATTEEWADFQDLAWSPDSRWLAFVRPAHNLLTQVVVYGLESGTTTELTSDRWDSYSPAWSPDGKWLWLLSDRHYESLVPSIWGSRQPDPFFDRTTKIYGLALQKSFRSPFQPADELHPGGDDVKPAEAAGKDAKGTAAGKDAKDTAAAKDAARPVTIDLEGIASRLVEVPVEHGSFGSLSTDGKRLYWLDVETTAEHKAALRSVAINADGDEPGTVLADVRAYELSANGKKLIVRKGDALYVFDAGAKAPAELEKSKVPLGGWQVALDPRIEYRQMFTEAWRLERDYFYDRALHGVDWKAMLSKYRPLADRVTDRAELADVFQQLIGELSALHMYVYGGDARRGADQAEPASLGAELERDEAAGGWRVAHVHRNDPDMPKNLSPLAAPGVDVREGDVIVAINGVSALSAPGAGSLLRRQAGKQVLLSVKRGSAPARSVIVTPLSPAGDTELRYASWEYARRLRVDSLSAGRLGYVHLRAMGPGDIAQWTRDYYPVFDRQGLIVDVRNNTGGNIDAWILGKLMRRAWMWWQPRVGHPFANMPFAFRGPMIVLVNERTASDGEAFAEGFRRLGLGKVLGNRTWGGEIWLSSNNFLEDRGIATAAETGVFSPEGEWLIENHGVDPDIVVDDTPRETFDGRDAQLEAAVKSLLEELGRSPVKAPPTPKYPDKSLRK
jgi:tricorn protease